jgi:hypothetical protein
MSCSLLDLPCHAWSVIGPFWGWIQVAFWIVVALAALWALAKIKEIGGWPAVAAAIGAAAYAVGWSRGRGGKPIVPDGVTDIDGPDAEPSPKPQRRPVIKKHGRRLNHETGNFEDY